MNGNEYLADLEVEEKIQKMSDRELLEFNARQTYDLCGAVAKHEKRISSLEGRNRKQSGIIGSIGGVIGAAVVAVITYFTGG